jgi:hypothetical protein
MTSETTQQDPTQAEPQAEHKWLQRLVGEWTYEGEATGPDGYTDKPNGTESVRSIGGLWVVAEGQGEMGGTPSTSIMTLGFDTEKKKFVGTWLGSGMTNLWIYEGTLKGDVLTLDCEGPAFDSPGKTAKYQDVIEMKSDDHRILTSRALVDGGKWQQFMETHYRRVK